MRWSEWLKRQLVSRSTPTKNKARIRLIPLEDRVTPATIIIDTFEGAPPAQNLQVSGAGPATTNGVFDAGYIFGGERDVVLNKLNGPDGPIVQALETGGAMNLNTPLNVQGTMTIVWDGDDNSGAGNALGLGLSLSGRNRMVVEAQTDITGIGSQIQMVIVDTLNNSATRTLNVPTTSTPLIYDVQAFTGIVGVNLASIGRIEMRVLNVPAAGDIEIRLISVTSNADLNLTKTISPASGPYAVGDTISYTVTVNNPSTTAEASSLFVFDDIPAQLSGVVVTPSQGTYSTVTDLWNVGTLAPATSATLTITGTITATGSISNYAEIDSFDGTDPDSTPGNRSSTEDDDERVTITAVGVDFGDAPASYGTLLPTGARHTTSGPTLGTLRDTETDGQPNATATGDGADEDGVTFGSLAVGGNTSATAVVAGGAGFLNAWIDFNGDGDFADVGEQIATNRAVTVGANSVPFTVPAGATVGNTFARFRITSASVASPSPTGALPSGEVEDYLVTITNDPLPDLQLTKTVDNLTPTLGSTVNYTLTLTNQTANPASNVVVRDLLPAGLLFVSANPSQGSYVPLTGLWTIGIVPGNATSTLTIVATVTGSGTIVNPAEIFATTPGDSDSTPGNGSTTEDDDDTATITVASVDFGDAPNSYGTILGANGPRHIATGVFLGTSRDSENTGQPNATATGDDITGLDDEDGVAFPTFTNGSVLTRGVSNSITVTASAAGFLNAWIDFNGNGTFDGAEQIAINEPLVAGANTITFTVPGGAALGGSFARFRVTDAIEILPSPLGLAASGEVEDYAIPIVDRADLSLTKAVNNPTPDIGDTVVFTITVTNAGPNAATGVTVRDLLPTGLTFVSALASQGGYDNVGGVWTVGGLAATGAGATATLQITATVTQSGTIVNNAEVRAIDQFDPDSTPNNTSTTEDDDDSSTLTVPALDFGDAPASYGTSLPTGARHRATGVRLGPTRDSENNGQPSATAIGDGADEDGVTGIAILTQGIGNTVTFNVQNNAAQTAFVNAWIDFNVDGDFDDVGEQVITDQAVTGNLSAAGTVTVPLLASPNINTFARVRISTVAGLGTTGLAIDGEVEDYAVLLRQQANLALTKTVNDPTPDIGEQIVYTITVTNAGPNPATNVTIRDVLPAGVAFVSATPSGAFDNTTGIWTIGTLAASGVGATATLQITAVVTQSGTITNGAAVQTSDQFDPNSTPGNGSTTEDDDDSVPIVVPLTDFGDAPTAAQSGFTGSYPTTIADDGARHRSTGVFMGASRDSENDGQPNATATADGADENGVQFGPTVTIGTTQTIQITSSGGGFVNAWIDYNRDGDWLDAGELILTNSPVVLGLNSFVINIPTTASEGITFTRFRISDASVATPTPTGLLLTGEVEDYQVTLLRVDDLGDAPATYGTLLADNGARHRVTPGGPFLGVNPPDIDTDGQPNATATGDDGTGTDDEDGVTLPTLTQGVSATINLTAPNGGRLDAFIDFNADGDFNDVGERITPAGGTFLTPGANTLSVVVPVTATVGTSYARFRISTVGNLGPIGGATDGEVEDYQVTISPGNGSIGDRVWLDNDGDGAQDVGEPGIVGATVTALYAGGNGIFGDGDDQTFTTTTDINGNYSFPSVPPGNYQVTVSGQPSSTAPTADRDGVGTPNTAAFTLAPLGNLTDVDFGYQGTLSLGDRVWYDVDADGVQDAGETGFTGVDVTLTYAGANGLFGDADDFTATTTTGANGLYTFANLPQGLYRVTVDAADIAAVRVPTADVDGIATPNTTLVTLTVSNPDVDFGYRGSVTLGNLVFDDVNNNGTNDGEAGIPNVVVELVQGSTVLATATTDGTGAYTFPGLFDGTYQVRLAASNFQLGGPLVGFTSSTLTVDPEADSTDNDDNGAVSGVLGVSGVIISGSITLTAGAEPTTDDGDANTNLTLDFGVFSQHSAGNLVFNDLDNDGIREAGEPGIAGVTVRLLDASGTNVLATTVTNGGGFYFFPNLTAGTYIIEIAASNFTTVLANFISSTGNPGFTTPTPFEGAATPDPDLVPTDNDDNGTTVSGAIRSLPFTIDNTEPTGETELDPSGALDNQSNFTIDFGVVQTASFGNRVWLDNNGNGTQQVGEPGIINATVTAIWAGPDNVIGTPDDQTFTTTTNINGDYRFENVPIGNYQVSVTTLPPNIAPTFDRDGTTTPSTASFALTANTSLTDVNFGYQGTLTLGDRVWYDFDNDGVQDVGETGFAGVDVTLVYAGVNGTFGDADDFTATTTTIANGIYSFPNLPPGEYQVTVDVNDLPAGRVPTADLNGIATPNTTTVTLSASRDDVDFGYRGSLSLGNLVFNDSNNDGSSAAETGLANVVVELLDQGGAVLATATTNGTGNYVFTGLFNGTYQVRLAASNFAAGGPLVGFTSSTLTVDPDVNPSDTDDNGSVLGTLGTGGVMIAGAVQLAVGTEPTTDDADTNTNLTVDFGVYSQHSVGNLVFNDLNNNGVRDLGEPGIDGVTVRLLDATGVNELAVTTTAGGGFYLFGGLLPGTYVVEVAAVNFSGPLSGFTSSTGNPGAITPTPFEGVATPDPDTVVTDNDDNGTTTGTVVRSLPFTIDNTEPTTESESDPSGAVDNQSNLTIDFGFSQKGSFGDRVWLDNDGDGTQDAGEPGIINATVTAIWAGPDNLPGTGDDQTFTTTTDINGNYTFVNVPNGGYQVTVTALPASTTPTFDRDGLGTPNTATFTLPAAANLTDVDFGYRGTLSLGDRVWYDLDNDGVQDVTETGLSGVTVNLLYAGINGTFGDADDFTATTTTGANGIYGFTNLPAGQYQVDVVPATLPTGAVTTFDADGLGTPNTATVTLATSRADVDFGYRGSLSLGNLVFNDVNNNGTNDGEAGLANVVVELLQGTTVIATATTDGTGNYVFTGLFDGTYQVRLATSNFLVGGPLVNFTSSTLTATPETNPTDNDDNGDIVGTLGTPGGFIAAASVQLTTGGEPTAEDGDANTNFTVDFGVFSQHSIGNLVFNDTNNNGVRDAGELGIDGVAVRLLDATGTTQLATTTTAGGGFYVFGGLTAGTYIIEIIASNFAGVLSGFSSSTGNPGFATPTPFEGVATPDPDAVDTDNDDNGTTIGTAIRSLPVTIDATEPTTETETDPSGTPNNQSNLTVDFGVVRLSSFGNRVWLDNDGDGTQDTGEPGIINATVTAVFAGVDGTLGTPDDVTLTTTTDINGNYTFVNVPVGQYRVTVTTLPANVAPTFDRDGTATANTATFTLPVAPGLTDVNFGYRGTLSLGDRVWYDLDNDGVQDVTETGLSGVTVNLLYAGINGTFGDADDFTATTTTGANGIYSFANLPAGQYQMSVAPATLPAGATPTFDADGIASANLATVTLTASRTDVDFGYRGSLSLGNLVFNDVNNNGTNDGEAGLANVVVELLQGTTVIATATTDGTGNYVFTGLFDGTYQVRLASSNFQTGGVLVGFTSSSLTFDPEAIPTDNDDNGSITGTLGAPGGAIIAGAVQLLTGAEPTTDDGDANTNFTVDFGVFSPRSVGNLVFNDLNNNGTRDVGEIGIDGVLVRLLDATGTNELATTLTAGGGFYIFPNLTTGTYVIEIAASNFTGVLSGFSSSTGNPGFATPTPFEGAATPDVDTVPTDNDDNGTAVGTAIRSLPFDLDATEPTTETETDPSGAPNNQSNFTVDFGVVRLGSFGDRVWLDNNGNGVQDTGEPGIINATVTAVFAGQDNVLGTPDDLTLTTTTDINGNFTFVNVPAGQYRVTISGTPASTTPTFDRDGLGTPNTATFTLPAATNLADVDFGYRGTLSLGDRVWYDLNNNGTQESSETGFAGVTVNLLYAGVNGIVGDADDFTATTTTGANGIYSFANLPAGQYQVSVAPATLPTGATPTFDADGIASANLATVTLTASRTDVDFGYRGSLSLGNLVFNDVNNNGTNDGEAGLANVAVELLQGATVFATATTSGTGVYTFTGLFEGTYQVRLAASNFLTGGVLAGFTSSSVTADPETNPTDNDDNGSVTGTLGTPGGFIAAGPVALTTNGEPTADDGDANTNFTVDFGVFSGHSIGNLVFNDLNNNGTRDSGENGLDGVTVRLLDSTGTTQVATTTTAGGGFYVFANLPAGTYVVEIPASNFTGVLSGFSSSTGNPGFATPTPFEGATTPDPDAVPTDNDDNGTTVGTAVRSAAITLDNTEPTTETETDPSGTANNQSNFTVDFGMVQKGRLVGTVFVDTDGDGVLDPGESTGIPNVTITAVGPNGTFTTTTTANGTYAFENIPAGNYTVTETQPNGYGSSSPNTLTPVVVPANGLGTANFGETTGSLSGRVWLNYNNQQDFNGPDAPIAGVTITLAGTDVNGVAVNRTTTTDVNGNYTFTNIVGGNYTVTETQPTGGTFPNSADGLDFIVAPNPGTTVNDVHTITFPAAAILTGYNFTEVPRTSLTGVVYHDLNNNGVRDTLEPGIAGVTVTLTGTDVTGAVVNTPVTTDANGVYTFANILPAANYAITEGTVPAPFIDGREQNGTPVATDVTINDRFGGIDLTNTANAANGFNFGEVQPVSISGSVYIDSNNDGVRQSTETGIANIAIRVTGTDDLGQPVNTIVSTDASGNYTFTNLRPGTYTVTETVQPAGLADGIDTVGSRGGSTTVNDEFGNIVMASGTAGTGYNFGESNRVDIQLTQTVNRNRVKVGETVVITYRVRNNGPSTANNVVMRAPLPSGMSYVSTNFILPGTYNRSTGAWSVGPLNSGEEAILRVVARVNRAGTFRNSGSVSTSNSETTLLNNFSNIDVTAAVAATQVTKKKYLASSYF